MTPKITISRHNPGGIDLVRALAQIRNSDVLVGIPMATTNDRNRFLEEAAKLAGATSKRSVRKFFRFRSIGQGTEPINNASLLYIHTHGSKVRNIPARPVIEPAIQADGNRQIIQRELADAAAAYFARDAVRANMHLRRAGIAGANASKAWFVDPRNLWQPNSPETIRRKGSDRPLIDTGALRKSITYVVRVHP